MIHIKRKKFFLPINEYYFYNQELDNIQSTGLINIFIQSKSQKSGFRKRIVETLLIDLKRDEEEIFGKIKKKYRYDIRQSNKDGIELIWNDSPSSKDIDEFCNFYNVFAKGLGIGKANKTKLIAFSKVKALIFTSVKSADKSCLIRHALIVDKLRVRLLYSGSLYRETCKKMQALIGRGNKALHWYEIQKSKSSGKKYYDFGGISVDGSTKNIDQFKLSFGGEKIVEYNNSNFNFNEEK